MSKHIRGMLVDDQEPVRTGLNVVRNTTADIRVVAEASDVREAVGILDRGEAIDAVCMDVRMPVMDGIEATAVIVGRG